MSNEKKNKINWKRYELGPETVHRPMKGYLKGYFFFKYQNIDCNSMDEMWDRIKEETLLGNLGYYCGYSNDSAVIAVHLAHPFNLREHNRVKYRMLELGVRDIKYNIKPEDNDLFKNEEISEEEELNLDQQTDPMTPGVCHEGCDICLAIEPALSGLQM